MRKIISILLILALLFISMFSLGSCEKKEIMTTVGVIEYVKTYWYHCVYIRPMDQDDNGIWIPIKVTKKTKTDSPFNIDTSSMPELAVGSVVEVVYDATLPKTEIWVQIKNIIYNRKTTDIPLDSYNAISVKLASSTEKVEKQKTPLKLTEGYEYAPEANEGDCDKGTVVHVAKIDDPISGYLIYLDDNTFDYNCVLTVYFIDSEAFEDENSRMFMTEEIKRRIESFEIGYKIKVWQSATSPFKQVGIHSAQSVDIYDHN